MNRSPASEACEALRELCRRFAAAGALVVALVSLLAHAPLEIACGRAIVTLVALLVAQCLGTFALRLACQCDQALERSRKDVSS